MRALVCLRERAVGGIMVFLSLILNVGSSVTSLEEMDQRFMSRPFTLSHT